MGKKETAMIEDKERCQSVDEMSIKKLSRWIALYNGINAIADEAEKNGRKFNYMHIKQPALEEYVNTISADVYKELSNNGKLS